MHITIACMRTGNGLNSRTLRTNCGPELHETELFLGNWPSFNLSNIFPIFYNPQAHFCVKKNTPLDHIQSHVNSVHISHPIHLRSIRLLSCHWHFRCNKQNIHIFHLPRACYNVPPISPPSSDNLTVCGKEHKLCRSSLCKCKNFAFWINVGKRI